MIWSDKYKGRIALYDYYLPMIGLVGLGLGKKTAELTEADMPAIKEKLAAMRAVSKQVSDVVSSQTALATGEVDILVGGGEWITAVLSADKPNLDWTIPEQGAVRWAQSIGVMKDSTKQDLALKFVQYIVSPEGQARLATSLLLGDAGKQQGRRAPDRPAEGGAALQRAGRIPEEDAALSDPVHRTGSAVPGCLDGNAAAVTPRTAFANPAADRRPTVRWDGELRPPSLSGGRSDLELS